MALLQSHLPLYQGARWHEAGKNVKPEADQHFGLVWERFFDGYSAAFDDFLNTTEQQGKADFVKGFAQIIGGENCRHYAERQAGLVQLLGGKYAAYRLDWRFATGLGMEHPVENGFTWHPTLGTPYLPGAGVKGLLRGWLEWNDAQDSRLQRWFGTQEKSQVAERAGYYVFFDAVPLSKVILCADVMTPHYGLWYEKGDDIGLLDDEPDPDIVPADWHSPVPVTFLAVKNASFLFSVALRESLSENERATAQTELDEVMAALQEALQWAGAGAKTAVGYGRMTPDENESQRLQKLLTKQAQQAELATLSANQRCAAALKDKMSAGNRGKGAGDGLFRELRELAQEAAAWPAADKAYLKGIAVEILAHLQINPKKQDTAKKMLRELE